MQFAVADVHALDFPDDSFDVVHAHQVLQHVGDPVRALREMRRVCRPGGVVAARDSDYAAMTWFPRVPLMDESAAAVRPGRPRERRRTGRGPQAPVLGAARRLHRRTGLGGGLVLRRADEHAWWSGLWADRTTASVYAELAVDGGHATADELAAIAGAWREWGGRDDAWFMVPHGEVLCRA